MQRTNSKRNILLAVALAMAPVAASAAPAIQAVAKPLSVSVGSLVGTSQETVAESLEAVDCRLATYQTADGAIIASCFSSEVQGTALLWISPSTGTVRNIR